MASVFNNFKYAFRGVRYAFRERMFRIHCAIGACVLILSLILQLTAWEWFMTIMIVGWMLTLEILNTASEHMVDLLKPEFHAHARIVKDLTSASVLIFSFVSAIIGVGIFAPRFVDLFYQLAERMMSL